MIYCLEASDSAAFWLPDFCPTVTMQAHIPTVHRLISPPLGSFDTTSECKSCWWRHLVHRGSLYGNRR